MNNSPRWDILGFGIVAVDDLLTVESYPPPDAKTPVLGKIRQGGGLTGTALVAASRVGAKCAYGGVLGEDELSAWTLAELEREGVDCSPVFRKADASPYHSVIIVDRTHHTRNIFFSGAGFTQRPPAKIDESLIAQGRVLFIDHGGVESMLHAAYLARRLGIPTVADIESNQHPQTDELIAQIEHLILSASFAAKLTGESEPAKAVSKLASRRETTQAESLLLRLSLRACTAVTAGNRGCWYVSAEEPGVVRHQKAYDVQVVDTTGCGDVFHGAYAAGIAWGWEVSRCIRFASATAAIKATRPGGRAGIPNRATVEQFLQNNDPR